MRDTVIHKFSGLGRKAQYLASTTALCSTLMIAVCAPAELHAQTTLPQGGNVVSGQAAIGVPTGNALTVTQSSSRAVIDWNSFSIGQNASVGFIQPSSSAAILNRVTGTTSSTIAGQITGNGQVFLVNPNGIAITPTGTVQVGGGFVASSLDIRNADFNIVNLNFVGQGASGGVSNAGAISGSAGSFVGLIGGHVSNSGTISIPLGRVAMGSGERIALNPTGDGFLQVAVPTGAVAADGRALVDVAGSVNAAGGQIEIKAATAQQAIRDAVNVSGALSARSVYGRSGKIVLDGGPGGNVLVSGSLTATGGKRSKGGSIAVTGRNVVLRDARVDVSGGVGGGIVQIGGGQRGSGDLQRAETTDVDQTSSIRADATVTGNGGDVTIWSDGSTNFGGFISAQGGPQGGNGGNAEVSGKIHLNLTGDYSKTPLANLSAAKGTMGTILFDPGTVQIIDQASLGGNSALNGPDTFTAQFISSQLASANVSIDTNNATGANGTAGDINLMSNAQISWSSNSSLTLNAARDINLLSGASINGSGSSARLTLRADSGASGVGTVNFAGGTQVNLANGQVDLLYNPVSNRTPGNGGTNAAAGTINGASYVGTPPAETWSNFINAGTLKSWMLVNNIYDLQNINNRVSGNYALGTDIDAGATSSWNSGAGFVPLGTNGAGGVIGGGFSGSFDGRGKTIADLTINRGSADNVGLFGYVNGGSIDSVGLTNVSVIGEQYVGGLVGLNSAGAISKSFVTGAVVGNDTVGGLVGTNNSGGSIDNSYATSSVQGSNAGGLVGSNAGSISNSFATGATSAPFFSVSGGLLGWNNPFATVSQSYFDEDSTGQSSGVGFNANPWGTNLTALSTSTFKNGSLPAGLSPSIWSTSAGSYPRLNWQNVVPPPPPSTTVVITATNGTSGSRVYGQGAPAFSYSVTDALGNALCSSDCSAYFSGAPMIDTTLKPTTSAGTTSSVYIAQGTLAPQAGYTFKFINDMLSVTPAPVSVTALGGSSTYGSSPANPGLSAVGLQNGEGVGVLTGLSNSFGITNLSNAGSYIMNVLGSLTNTNYMLTGTTNGSWTVNPAPVNVTALGGSSTYGSSPSNPGLSATGLQNGQNVSVLTGLSNSFGITNLSNAGAYVMNVLGSLTNANYTVASTINGSWTVNPAPVTVTALGGSSTYGSSPANPGLSATGLQNGESIGTLTGLSNSFGITNFTNAGSHPTNVAGVLTNPNYTITGSISGSWLVNPAPVDITALGGTSTYGSSPANPGLSATGLQNGESISVLTGLSNSFGITNTTKVGDYTMNVAGTLTNSNYTITSTKTNNWAVTALRGSVTDGSSPAAAAPPLTTGSITPPSELSAPTVAGNNSAAGLRSSASGLPGRPIQPAAQLDSAPSRTAPIIEGRPAEIPFANRTPSQNIIAVVPPSVPPIAKPAGIVDLALTQLNRTALFKAVEKQVSEITNSVQGTPLVLATTIAGTSLAVTAGVVGWLLRGGALLSALLSSMPLWHGFDPLTVVTRPKRNEDDEQPTSSADLLFDEARDLKQAIKGLKS